MAQIRSPREVAIEFKMTFAEVMYICMHHKHLVGRQERDMHDLIGRAIADPTRAAEMSRSCRVDWIFREGAVKDVRRAIAKAMDRVTDENGDLRHFRSKELGTPSRRGSFDWIKDLLYALDKRTISRLFEESGAAFFRLCEQTARARRKARVEAMKKKSNGLPTPSSRWRGESDPGVLALQPDMPPDVLEHVVRRHVEPPYRPKVFIDVVP